MKRRHSSSTNKVFILVFTIAFGLVALALGYQAVKNSSDIRSRATQIEHVYKQWEFGGNTNEGWSASGTVNAIVKNGYLIITQKKAVKPTAFFNNFVSTSFPKGLKTVSFSMAVGALSIPTGVIQTSTQEVTDQSNDTFFQQAIVQKIACAQDLRLCTDGSYVGRGGIQCTFMPCSVTTPKRFTGQLYYRLANKKIFEAPLEFYGIADGKFQEYKVTLPNIDTAVIEQIRFVLTSGVKAGDTVSVDWIRLSGTTSGVTSTPTPPTGCWFQKVVCVTEPCDPILVCPSPNPTCTPRPACLDANPSCMLVMPPDGFSFCPITTMPSPTTIIKPPITGSGCIRSGCSNELCVDSVKGGMESTCVYKESYACYDDARCEKQANGLCSWTQTEELSACLSGSVYQ